MLRAPSPLRRRLGGLLIALFWLAMVGWLVARQRGHLPDGQVPETADGETWMAIELDNGERAGQLHIARVSEPLDGVVGQRTSFEADLALVLLGRPTTLQLGGWTWRPRSGQPTRFSLDLLSAGHDLNIAGSLDGRRLSATIITGGESFPLDLPLAGDLALSPTMGSPLSLPPLAPGEEVVLTTFDPTTLGSGETLVRGLGEEPIEVAGVRVPTRKLGVVTAGLEATVWVDAAGELVRAETPFGLVLRRVGPAELAAPPAAQLDSVELPSSTAIRPRGQRPRRGAQRLLLTLSGTANLPPASELQHLLDDGNWEILAATPPSGETVPPTSPVFAPYLASEPLLPADHPAIAERTAQIVGDESEPWQRALLLYAWVFENVEKKPLLSVPSALDVLRRPEGDCNEHTVLFVALARAAGLPSRIAVGLVWSDLEEGFFYHAWPEVWAGHWVAMDPTLGQPVADATHVKLLEGGIERWAALVPYLGRLQIEVLEVG